MGAREVTLLLTGYLRKKTAPKKLISLFFITAQPLIQSTGLVVIDLISVCLMPEKQACM